ncbi:MAG: hypothetical protein NT031_14245 [Planctomycetota bacterium]|nr:hypothetical protein [Planctomycetota bacterium]
MSDEPDNTDRRLEGLLRRWGAQEAAAHSAPGALGAARQGQNRPAGGWLWRWSPAMAAAVLLAAAVGVYFLGDGKVREVVVTARPAPVASAPSDAGEVARLKGQLAEKDAAAQASARE